MKNNTTALFWHPYHLEKDCLVLTDAEDAAWLSLSKRKYLSKPICFFFHFKEEHMLFTKSESPF